MLLRSWLADWRAPANPLLRFVLHDRQTKRRTSQAAPGFEVLEERCVLTTLDLANLGPAGVTIFGVDGGDTSGYSVSGVGDVNGDGFDDVLIGAERGDGVGNVTYGAGESYVVFGGPSLPTTIDLANLGAAGVTIFGVDSSDTSGRAVSAAGDVNGDGLDDLLIGADRSNGAGNTEAFAGESYLIFGSASLPATINLASLGALGVTIFGVDAGDQSGISLSSAGDVNGDGFDDVLIGAFASAGSGNFEAYAGESYVVFGAATLSATIDLASLGTAGVTLFGIDAGDNNGVSVSGAGDVNGDGFDDMLIGAISADGADNLEANAGETYLIFGADDLPEMIDLSNLGSAGVTIFGADGTDLSGYSVSNAGDVNGDDFDDMIIGAKNADAGGDFNAGKTYLVFGAATLPATIDLANLGAAGVVISGVDASDYSGRSVSNAGDFNGDGFDDLLIGALLAENSGGINTDSGESYLIFGAASLPQAIDLANLGSAGFTILGGEAGDNIGQSVSSAGDVNDDGFDDLLIGARHADGVGNAKPNAGETYIVFGGFLQVGGPAVTWVKKQPPVVVLPQLIVDPGFSPVGGTLTLSVNAIGSTKKLLDQFFVPASSGLGTTTGPQFANGQLTLQISLNANATPEGIQAFLRGITFSTKGKGLKTLTRTLDVSLAPAGGPTHTVRQTIDVRKKA